MEPVLVQSLRQLRRVRFLATLTKKGPSKQSAETSIIRYKRLRGSTRTLSAGGAANFWISYENSVALCCLNVKHS